MSRRAHTKAVITALGAAGLSVGDGVAPTAASQKWAVVYGGGTGSQTGSIADERSDVAPLIQVTSVGTTQEQAEWVADKATNTLLARPCSVSIPGRQLLFLALEHSEPVRRDTDVTPALFYGVDLFRVASTPV